MTNLAIVCNITMSNTRKSRSTDDCHVNNEHEGVMSDGRFRDSSDTTMNKRQQSHAKRPKPKNVSEQASVLT